MRLTGPSNFFSAQAWQIGFISEILLSADIDGINSSKEIFLCHAPHQVSFWCSLGRGGMILTISFHLTSPPELFSGVAFRN